MYLLLSDYNYYLYMWRWLGKGYRAGGVGCGYSCRLGGEALGGFLLVAAGSLGGNEH